MEWKKISKKAPCPCDSGKKYGDCCGFMEKELPATDGTRFAAMKSIAYKGRIGRKREDFCRRYIITKTETLRGIQKKLTSAEVEVGTKVTCVKGCTICCSMYIEASVQECEAIVYYLYHHDTALSSFLQSYPRWRADLRERGDVFKGRNRYYQPRTTVEEAASLWYEFTEDEDRYFSQDIPCPFLSEALCVIYDVRPYVCASYAALTPPEYCRFDSKSRPQVIKAIPQGVRSDRSFYCPDQLGEYVLSTMPVMVYEMLRSGPACFSTAGPKDLEPTGGLWAKDPEVAAIYRKYVR